MLLQRTYSNRRFRLGLALVLPIAVAGAFQFAYSQGISATLESATKVTDNAKQSQVESKKNRDDKSEEELKEPEYKKKSVAELKRALSSMQFKVTQNADTEPAFRNRYWDNKKEGIYRCVVCGLSLFSSEAKYKSGTGWPSFFAPIKKDHVGYKTDYYLFYPRTEVHCKRCNAHLGHVFDDGPKNKTGKRYCMNSAAMKFLETAKKNDFDD